MKNRQGMAYVRSGTTVLEQFYFYREAFKDLFDGRKIAFADLHKTALVQCAVHITMQLGPILPTIS